MLIRYVALLFGRSLQGNHEGAPPGCPATITPSRNSSHPDSPALALIGRGLPPYVTVTEKPRPALIGDLGVTMSLPRCDSCLASPEPSIFTRETRSESRSRVKRRSSSTATPSIRALALNR